MRLGGGAKKDCCAKEWMHATEIGQTLVGVGDSEVERPGDYLNDCEICGNMLLPPSDETTKSSDAGA